MIDSVSICTAICCVASLDRQAAHSHCRWHISKRRLVISGYFSDYCLIQGTSTPHVLLGNRAAAPVCQAGAVSVAEWGVMVMAPHQQATPSRNGVIEASVHSLGPKGRTRATAAAAEAPAQQPLLAVVTFQFAAPGTNIALQANSFDDPPTAAQVPCYHDFHDCLADTCP